MEKIKKMGQIKNFDKEYVELHSEVLKTVNNDFWREKICELLTKEIRNTDNDTRKFLIDNPYDRFIIYDNCFVFGYRPTLKKLICLNDYIVVHDIVSNEILIAIKLIFELYQTYGSINCSYSALLAECL